MIQTAADIVIEDLDAICNSLGDDLATLQGARMLITGGAGFLGYYLVQTITHANATRQLGASVTVFDNFSRGTPQWLSSLAQSGDVTLVRHDMRHPLPGDAGEFDYIIHAASIASPTYYRRDPIGTMDANVGGLRSLLDHAKAQADRGKPIQGFLFFSSSEIYGDPDAANIPTAEDYRGLVSCTGPRACYDEAKRYGETLCVNFFKQYGVPTKMARPFNNFGPGLKITDGRVIPDFCRDVFAGRDIVMLSDGLATRTFCYASDSITGYYKTLIRGQCGEGYNIGTATPEISMNDLAEKIAQVGRELFGYGGKVVRKASADADYLIDNPNRRSPVLTKAATHLDYHPRVSLEEGLRRTLLWYADHREAEEK